MDPTSISPATNTTPFPPFAAVSPPSTAAPFPPVSFPVPVSISIPVSVPAPAEANNHVAPAANAAPSAAASTGSSHLPYADMIVSAIEALKEKNGSSKRAIAKYIEQVYRDLPSTHSTLLTSNLKRLKASGQLVMVKKSYKLPRSDASTSSPQRGRGRPPKPKPQSQPQPQLQSQPQLLAQPFPQPLSQNVPVANAQVWAALGLGDEPVEVKRGPGRPRKSGVGVEGAINQAGPPMRRGRPPGSKNGPGRPRSKRPGRPPKPKSVLAISNGLKRRPGRPPKIQSKPTIIPFAPPVPAVPAEPQAGAVPTESTVPTTTVSTVVIPVVSPRPRGRPKKNAAALPAYGAVPQDVDGVGRGRGRGRGRGVLAGRSPNVAAAGRNKNPGARPVGRPKKETTAAATSGNAVTEELRGKLEYFQSKVKESLSVLKRHFNHESPVTAIAAIQELEVLSTVDLNAPLRDETQDQHEQEEQQSPWQQQAPQQHLFAQPQQLFQQQSFVQAQQVPQQPQFYQQQMPQVQLLPHTQPQQPFHPQGSAPS